MKSATGTIRLHFISQCNNSSLAVEKSKKKEGRSKKKLRENLHKLGKPITIYQKEKVTLLLILRTRVFVYQGWSGEFLFYVHTQTIFFPQLLRNSLQLFSCPNKDKNYSLIFLNLILLFCGEFGCVSFPNFPVFLFSALLNLFFSRHNEVNNLCK